MINPNENIWSIRRQKLPQAWFPFGCELSPSTRLFREAGKDRW